MTPEIALTLAIIFAAIILFATEKLCVDLVAASPLGGWGWNLWCGTGWIVFRATILVS